MGLLKSAGRAVAHGTKATVNNRATRAVAGNRAVRRTGALALGGAAVIGGIGASMSDSGGVWQQEVFPNAQELAFGNPRMVQESMRGGVTAAMTGAEEDVMRPTDYYYNRPVNLRGNESLGIPVSGEMVFGMYNLRR